MPITKTTWQRFSFNLLRGRLFSDNIGMVVTRLAPDGQLGSPPREGAA